jgi:predicted transposase YbfD/YdcC
MESSFHKHFRWIPDPRVGNNKRHKLLDVIILSVIAVICGADSWYDIEEFGHSKKGFLEQLLSLENGIPSHDTFNRVFMVINHKLFERAFRAWSAELSSRIKEGMPQPLAREHIGIDGKCLRGSADSYHELGALYLVSAWSERNKLVLGQQKVSEKSNEITAIPELLSLLDIKSAVVTIDAMGTQTKIAEQIIEKEADYILSLKENHPTLYEQTESLFNTYKEDSYDQDIDKGHGRIEIRTCKVINQLQWLDEKENWKELKSIIKIESVRNINGKSSQQNRYYISSLTADAAFFNESIRKHWGIENNLHWQLDVSFGEDYNRTRSGEAAENLALVRKMALNILKAEKSSKRSIKGKRLKAAWDNDYLVKLLTTHDF